MNRAGIFLFVFFILVATSALAQVPVSSPRAPQQTDTLEPLEQSAAYKDHEASTTRLKDDAQRQLDSLFSNHEDILNTTKAEALKDWEAAKLENNKTLKALREEEVELRKELKKEQQKSNPNFKTKLRKSFNKTKYEVEDAE